ncbi:MAG TPA: protein-glutamate O-methyltransferase CheR [Spirochaetia bacterium]|nr:protein-glutamate O-methyltransferase CheR [Spirochaetia bacterium]
MALGIPILSDTTFNNFRALIFEKTGIHMRDGKQILISNRLRRRLAALGLSTYEEYYDYLTSGAAPADELHNFIDAVSTNETYFFREANHFNVLHATVLPEILSRRKHVSIWSAGCSTGEEPYTLRIVMDEHLGGIPGADAAIVGTDISTAVIRRARDGVYNERALRFVPPAVLDKYFTPAVDGLRQASPALRASVSFKVHNLFKDPPPGEPFDIIFCRNVMIYFDKATQTKLVDEIFSRALRPDGYLFIGHSESLSGFSRRFRYAASLKAPIYRLKKEGEP